MFVDVEPFAEAARAYVDLVRRVAASQWSGPGLGPWDLRSLVGHTSRSLITVQTYLDRPAATETVPTSVAYYLQVATGAGTDAAAVTERGRAAGVALGDDPLATVSALADHVLARVLGLALAGADPLIETIVGGMHLSSYLPTRTFELVVHGFDIATAADLDPPSVSRDVLASCAALAAEIAAARGDGRELLLTLTGRRRLPPGFSVV
ncbi:MAG: maleylpyruvate isomerase N-terminal domain-containing protein [Propionibacteriaceae bacterium]